MSDHDGLLDLSEAPVEVTFALEVRTKGSQHCWDYWCGVREDEVPWAMAEIDRKRLRLNENREFRLVEVTKKTLY